VSVGGVSVRGVAAFVVTVVYGVAWEHGVGRREQPGWDEHAAFMDALVADGTVLLGGPVGDGADVLLAVEAADETALRAVFAADPWHQDGRLRIGRIRPWQLWLDGRAQAGAAMPSDMAPCGFRLPDS
jgi:uncharacterized protein YciI